MIDLSAVDVIPARYHESRTTAPRLVVVHVNAVEEPATGGARNVAVYCQRPADQRDGSKGGYHALADDVEVVRGGYDDWQVNGAAGANRDGLHVCLIGDANQTPAEWADGYSQAAIDNAAQATAWWCRNWKIPATKLGPVDVRNAKPGICGHHDVSLAYGQSDHYDPGPDFPWAWFIHRVRFYLTPPEDDLPLTESDLNAVELRSQIGLARALGIPDGPGGIPDVSAIPDRITELGALGVRKEFGTAGRKASRMHAAVKELHDHAGLAWPPNE